MSLQKEKKLIQGFDLFHCHFIYTKTLWGPNKSS